MIRPVEQGIHDLAFAIGMIVLATGAVIAGSLLIGGAVELGTRLYWWRRARLDSRRFTSWSQVLIPEGATCDQPGCDELATDSCIATVNPGYVYLCDRHARGVIQRRLAMPTARHPLARSAD